MKYEIYGKTAKKEFNFRMPHVFMGEEIVPVPSIGSHYIYDDVLLYSDNTHWLYEKGQYIKYDGEDRLIERIVKLDENTEIVQVHIDYVKVIDDGEDSLHNAQIEEMMYAAGRKDERRLREKKMPNWEVYGTLLAAGIFIGSVLTFSLLQVV